MRALRNLILCVAALGAVSCTDIVNDLALLHLDVENLKVQVEQVNSSIESLDAVVGAISVHYVTEVNELLDNEGTRIGYSLVYEDGRVVDLVFGKDGTNGRDGRDGRDGRNGFDGWDGKMPKVGVAQDSDGMWYWTIDGEWLLDDSGQKLLASGTGLTPKMKIEDGAWYVSYDDGHSWEYLSQATVGNYSLFESIDYKSSYEYVYLTLADGTVLELPRYIGIEVTFTEQVEHSISYSEQVKLEYSVAGGNGDVTLDVVCDQGLDYKVLPVTSTSGNIIISSDKGFVSGQVLVFLRRNHRTFMKRYGFTVKYQGLSQNGTSNCYLVNRAGTYRFYAGVKGNSYEPLDGVPSKAIVLWESYSTSVNPSIGSVVRNVSLKDGYVEFTANLVHEGNAVIAVQDDEGNILWSWHIWVAKFYPEREYCVFESHPGLQVMARNLGALSSAANDVRTNGLYYQYGRKDPFLGAESYDDWQSFVKSTAIWPEPVKNSSKTGSLAYSVLHPMTFIGRSDNYYGWNCYEDSDWTSDKSMTDPCPPGWKVISYDNEWYELDEFGVRDYDRHIMTVPRPYATPECVFPLAGSIYAYDSGLGFNSLGNESMLWVSGYSSGGNVGQGMLWTGLHRGGGWITYKSEACSVRCCSEN